MLAECIIPPERHGQRLDRALESLAPEAGLRARRRMIEQGLARLDGKTAAPGVRVRAGQLLRLDAPEQPPELPDIPILAQNEDFVALGKPAGLHCASLAGKPGPSLEAALADILPGARLVNRLDRDTSGVVLAALTPEAERRFRELENHGLVRKTYLALVHGRVEAPMILDQALDTANRARTRVLAAQAPPLRQTRVAPLRQDGDTTLIQADILKGARHQIRCHLAHAGHPLVGDTLYGPDQTGPLRLHCLRTQLPGMDARRECAWAGEEQDEDASGGQRG